MVKKMVKKEFGLRHDERRRKKERSHRSMRYIARHWAGSGFENPHDW